MDDDEIKILTVEDVSKMLGIHIQTAQKMFHEKSFPRIKGVGTRLLVEREAFLKYIRNEEYEIK